MIYLKPKKKNIEFWQTFGAYWCISHYKNACIFFRRLRETWCVLVHKSMFVTTEHKKKQVRFGAYLRHGRIKRDGRFARISVRITA